MRMQEGNKKRCHGKADGPQQLLASVSEGVQRLQQHLKSHPLAQRPLCAPQISFPTQQVSERTKQAGCRRPEVLVEDEGVLVALQARNNVHRAAFMLGAAFFHKMGRLGNKLKDHHSRMREEGRQKEEARRVERRGEHNPLKLAFPWQRKRRRGVHNESGIFRMGGARANAEALIKKGKEHEREMDVRAAVQSYEDADKLVPNVVDTVCLAAKAWSDVCYLDEIFKERLSDQDKRDVNMKAIEYSKKAIALAPARALPHVACCISMGRLAVFSDNKAKVKLAKEAREQAVIALQKEPYNDLAHHLMGRWHWEMANLNGIVRTLIRLMYGTELAPGTHLEALNHYRRAAELNPQRLVHRVELGRSLAKMGEKERALKELEHAMTLEVEDINAHLQKVDAELLLKELQRSVRRSKPHQQTAGEGSSAGAAGSSASERPGPQLPWNWKLPQLPNPLQRQEVEEPTAAVAQPDAESGGSSLPGGAGRPGTGDLPGAEPATASRPDQATSPGLASTAPLAAGRFRRMAQDAQLQEKTSTKQMRASADAAVEHTGAARHGEEGVGWQLPQWLRGPLADETLPEQARPEPARGAPGPERHRGLLFNLDLARIRNPFEAFKRRVSPAGG